MTLQLGGGGAITGCTSLADPVLTLDGLVVGGTGRFDNTVTIGGTVLNPNITLNQTGSAEYSGDVVIGDPATYPNTGVKLFEDGQVYIRSNLTAALQVRNTSDSSEIPISLNTDGSATFLSTISSLKVNGDRTDVGTVFSAKKGGVENASIMSDGSAEFSGQVSTTNAFEARRINGSDICLDVGISGVGTKARIDADGSAEFAGGVNSSSITNEGMTINAGGGLTVQRNSAGNIVLRGYLKTDITSNIYADGSAEFSGTVKAGSLDNTQDDESGVICYSVGAVQVQRISTAGLSHVWRGYQGSTKTSEILANGASTFASTLNIAGSAYLGAADGVQLHPAGYIAISRTATASNVFLVYNTGNSTPTIAFTTSGNAVFAGSVTSNGSVLTRNVELNLEADDDTKYTTTTDADGNETLVYNGATLDVKDRLTKLDTALTGLKAALVSTTDHASLKAALIAALADI